MTSHPSPPCSERTDREPAVSLSPCVRGGRMPARLRLKSETLTEHRAVVVIVARNARARGDDRSIPMPDRGQWFASGRVGGTLTRRWSRTGSDAPDARAGPATVDERTAGVLSQSTCRVAVGADHADAGCRARRRDARGVWRGRRCPGLVDGRQHRAAARGRSPRRGPPTCVDQHRLSSGTGCSASAATRCRAHPCWCGPPGACGNGGRARSAMARALHCRGRCVWPGTAMVPGRRSGRHGDHDRGRGRLRSR